MKPFFVFSGQGAQCVGMGKDLAETSAAAAEIFKTADGFQGTVSLNVRYGVFTCGGDRHAEREAANQHATYQQ